MTDQVQVGFVGLGTIAETHLSVLAERHDAAIQFTVDPHVTKPVSFRGTKPPHYGRLEDALSAHRPDLIVLATPTDTHADLTVQALTQSSARVLVEKPLVHDLDSLAHLRSLPRTVEVQERVFVAHHFAFSPEVRWAAEQIAENPQWGPVTGITSAFHDPYILRGEQAFTSYISSWTDSGVNQLSTLARFVDLTALTSAQQLDDGASAWCTAAYLSRGITGTARLRTSWLTGTSSKETALTFGESGVDIWIDHTSMTGFTARGGTLLATHGNDGLTPRKVAHYRPLYASLLSTRPDPVMSFGTAVTLTELHHATPPGDVSL
ncbi:Gfo/Idh/MocA family oxidoreductase [Streptomyces sp. ACA25]|uniref:Gfo/Idh/MocA family protein n=1 Tax=Streptomyces sp. ACA25 TaxID=3022596 RepID=UPI002307EF92|nr:Gfo/Idh/MocA family oxidoreductase [Streptomyces sp. ACA25]MDB1088712.1 Gfo/Idh/MocA family oxidoreductase [Streptomyces sp. ACA25]